MELNRTSTRRSKTEPDASLKCEFCSKVFSSNTNLNKHIDTAQYCLAKRKIITIKYSCDPLCGKTCANAGALARHQAVCSIYNHIKWQNEMQPKLDELQKKYEIEKKAHLKCKNALKQKDEEIKELTDQLNLKKGYIEGVKNAKTQVINHITNTQPKTINNTVNYNNAKVAALPIDHIQPFNMELIKNNLYKYTLKEFLKKEKGIIDFLKDLIFLDVIIDERIEDITSATHYITGETDSSTNTDKSNLQLSAESSKIQREQSYVCTDTSRNKFHRLKSERLWEKDGGAAFLKTVMDELGTYSKRHYDELWNNVNNSKSPQEKEINCDIIQDMGDFYYGILGNGKARDKLFAIVRNGIVDLVAV